jgi:putative transposase
MGRPLRAAAAGHIYHVLNRANARARIFQHAADFEAFEQILADACVRVSMRVLAYCLMPNHWHLVLWPRADGDLSDFTGWVTLTHTQRWHAWRGSAGSGHLYQGRFKSFPVQADAHFLAVCRYVERNPLRAGLVRRAEDWCWSSMRSWLHKRSPKSAWLCTWPIERPDDWCDWVNEPQSEAELEALRRSVHRGRPYGRDAWVQHTAQNLGLLATLRSRGRPPRPRIGGVEKGS